jgi:hypothetical protein
MPRGGGGCCGGEEGVVGDQGDAGGVAGTVIAGLTGAGQGGG